jgi:hypothetical protein
MKKTNSKFASPISSNQLEVEECSNISDISYGQRNIVSKRGVHQLKNNVAQDRADLRNGRNMNPRTVIKKG